MKHQGFAFAITICLFVSTGFYGCAGSKYGMQKEAEATVFKPNGQKEVINYAMMRKASDNLIALRTKSRGFTTEPVASNLLTLAATGIKQLIAKEKGKYQAAYSFAMNNLYFYNTTSARGPFDPVGMQFTGFTLIRTIHQDGKTDTAFVAGFEPDLSVPENIIRDGMFTLKLTYLKVNYAKAKIPAGKNTINIDMDISLISSYYSGDGSLNTARTLGTFLCTLRNVPVNAPDSAYKRFYAKPVSGRCFIVPRSYSYITTSDADATSEYSQGNYSIVANVKESSTNTFVNRVVIDHGADMIDATRKGIKLNKVPSWN